MKHCIIPGSIRVQEFPGWFHPDSANIQTVCIPTAADGQIGCMDYLCMISDRNQQLLQLLLATLNLLPYQRGGEVSRPGTMLKITSIACATAIVEQREENNDILICPILPYQFQTILPDPLPV
jgi:hypothetical protein